MTKTIPVSPQQESLLARDPGLARLNAAGGIVHVADLEAPLFDQERILTLVTYVGEIGMTIAEVPRDSSVTDKPLELFRNDFLQAEPANLNKGLYFSPSNSQWPRKSVVRVSGGHCDLDRRAYPGVLPAHIGVSVSEVVYEEIVKNAPYFANQIDNKTQKANGHEPVIEARADLAGESVVYALSDKHQILEARDQALLKERTTLKAVQRSIAGESSHRIRSLEPYRLDALIAIQEVARIACKSLGYGTNQTRSTLNAIASNTHRSPEAAKWWKEYTQMAMNYNDAVRGKVNQSIYACIDQIGAHRHQLISNIDREYED